MGWRDIALRSVERTVIASVFPKMGANHKLPLFNATGNAALADALVAADIACT
jgi:hypothetical protein